MRRLKVLLFTASALGFTGAASAQDVTSSPQQAAAAQAVPENGTKTAVPTASQPDSRFAATPATREGSAARLDGKQQSRDIAEKDALTPRVAAHHTGRSSALMIVGGAGIVLGALIGGQAGGILMLGSGAVGLYGLYLYLQ